MRPVPTARFSGAWSVSSNIEMSCFSSSLTPARTQYGKLARRSLASFSELRDRRYLEVQPARVEIVELPRAMNFSEFTRRYPSNAKASEVAIINGVEEDQELEKGRIMKRIMGGELPGK